MLKRILSMLVIAMLWTNIGFAEELLYSTDSGYSLTLLNAKTVNESENIIKARVKEALSDKQDGYYVLTWIIQRSTRKVTLRDQESYDKDGNLKSSIDYGLDTKVNKVALEKIIRYIDETGK